MGDFIGSPMFFVIGGVVLVGLIGLLLVLRNKKDED
jgi:LPXTG-motif cell wall-anchored protein